MATGDLKIDALLAPKEPKWQDTDPTTSTVDVSYSFITQIPDYYAVDAVERNNFIALNETQQKGAELALDLWEQVANIKFTKVDDAGDGGQIRFGTANIGTDSSAHAYYPDSAIGGDVWLNTDPGAGGTNLIQTPGSFGFATMIHELGHALGLKHPGDYNAGGGGTEGPYLPKEEDTNQYTIMSYNGHTGSSKNPQTPLLYDIAAIQYLYGANMTVRTGNDVYQWDTDQNFVEAIWDAGGNDTIDASKQTRRSIINLGAGSFSSIGFNENKDITDNLAIAFNVTIENAIGGFGNDEITGNETKNSLQGAGGADTLTGGAGNDTFVFKSATEGVDTIEDFDRQQGDKILLDVSAQADQFNYNAQTGEISFDNQVFVTLANTPADFTIGTDLVFNDTTPVDPEPPVDPVDPSLIGTNGDDVLVSRNDQGDSVLGLAGNDQITGGLGDDTLDGGAGNDILSGGAGNDILMGQDGNDTLNGGLGNDSMSGGLGDDSYIVDASTDVVTELINQGHDTVLSSTSYTLSDNVEDLTLTGVSAVNGTGNSLNNTMFGNAANNYLYAGDGADQVNGDAGNDYLYGQAGDDTLNGGHGKDWLVGDLGDDLISGGHGNDRLIGGLGKDSLVGEKGKDRLTGGADADRFIFNSLKQGFDIITDFKTSQGDRIEISAKKFGGNLKQGKLLSGQFTLGSKATDDKTGFIYNESSGRLFFDVDGIGGQRQIQVAKLATGTTLASGNIFVA